MPKLKLSARKSKSKKPTSAWPKFRTYFSFKPIEIAIILAVILLGIGGIVFARHEHNTDAKLNIAPSSSQSSSDSNCLLSNSGCPDNSSSSTSTSTAQTPKTTSTPVPDSSTPSNNCSDITIPYTTIEQDVTWVQTGQTMSLPGTAGTDRVCNGVTTVIVKPFNAIEYIGTGTNLSPTTITPPAPTTEPYQTETPNNSGLTESQATQQCDNNLANGADASDPQGYLITCMHQYGY
jgi:cytoskeletal protein RodZ